MRRVLCFRRYQLMPRPADGQWELSKIYEIKLKRRKMRMARRYWVDPLKWIYTEIPEKLYLGPAGLATAF